MHDQDNIQESHEGNEFQPSSASGPSDGDMNQFVLRILQFVRRLQLSMDEFIGRNDVRERFGRLFQFVFVPLCMILLIYPVEQLVTQFLRLEKDWTYWNVSVFVGILYFGVYTLERLLLLHIAVFDGAQRAIVFAFLGMEAIIKSNVELEMGNNILILLMGGICFGVVMLMFPVIAVGPWLPPNMGGTDQLNVTASTNHLNPTMQTCLIVALTLGGIILRILGGSSQCLNYILQFLSTGTLILVHVNVIQIIVNEMVLFTAGRDNFLQEIVKKYEKFIEVIRLWIKIYFWILWGYDQILESFPENGKDAIDLPGVRYGLGILAMSLTYCYMKYFK